jgi:hypothetical protein
VPFDMRRVPAGRNAPMPGYAPASPTSRTRRPVNVPSLRAAELDVLDLPRLCASATMSSLRVDIHVTGSAERCASAATTCLLGVQPALPPKPPPTCGVTTRSCDLSVRARAQQPVQQVRHLGAAVERQPAVVAPRTAAAPCGSIGATAMRWLT